MPIRFFAAALTSLLLVSGSLTAAPPAQAVESNQISIVTTPGVLTWPDGDGIRDSTVVQFTSVLDTTVAVDVWKGETPLASFQLALPAAAGAVVDAGLYLDSMIQAPGVYTVHIIDDADESVRASAELVVGSGRVVSVTTVGTTPTQLYPYVDGIRDELTSTVLAVDETGLGVPAAGSARILVGSTQKTTPVVVPAEGGLVTASAAGLPFGSAQFSVALRPADGGSAVRSASVAVALKPTAITAVGISVASTQVYPVADGYRDTVSIKSAVSAAGVPFSFPITGSIQVRYGAKTIARWSLTSLGSRSVAWNGLNDGRVVPGTYTIIVSAKGPQGSTLTKTSNVYVSGKKITTLRTSRTYTAASVLSEYFDYSYLGIGSCSAAMTAVICDAYGADMNPISDVALASYGSVAVPYDVRTATQFGAPRARVSVSTAYIETYDFADDAYGGVITSQDSAGVQLGIGTRTTGWVPMAKGESYVDLGLELYGYITVRVESFTVAYEYKVLK